MYFFKLEKRGEDFKKLTALADDLLRNAAKRKYLGSSVSLAVKSLLCDLARLRRHPDALPYISKHEWKTLLANFEVEGAEVKALSTYLTETGQVLHFPNKINLKHLYILNPKFFSDIMECVLSLRKVGVKEGRATKDQLVAALKRFVGCV